MDNRRGRAASSAAPRVGAEPPTKRAPQYDLSLVLACFNEEPFFLDSVNQITHTLDHTPWSYEIIFVDDCSGDRTRDLITRLVETDKKHHLRKLLHTRNTGRGRAVSDGMKVARGRIVGFIDIDLETPARYIPPCVLAVSDGYDVATAERIFKFTWRGLLRYALSQGYTKLQQVLLGVHLRDTESGFKFFNRERILPILDEISDEGWFWDTEVMVRSYFANLRIIEIPALFLRRFDKKSSVKVIGVTTDYLRKILAFRKTVASIRRAPPAPPVSRTRQVSPRTRHSARDADGTHQGSITPADLTGE
jgi:glycosyltransferase involved in cell wall biosynthesis